MDESGSKRRRLTPEEKLEIFLEVQKDNITKAEVMRRHVIHSTELARIEKRAQESLIDGFKKDKRKREREAQGGAHRAERGGDAPPTKVYRIFVAYSVGFSFTSLNAGSFSPGVSAAPSTSAPSG